MTNEDLNKDYKHLLYRSKDGSLRDCHGIHTKGIFGESQIWQHIYHSVDNRWTPAQLNNITDLVADIHQKLIPPPKDGGGTSLDQEPENKQIIALSSEITSLRTEIMEIKGILEAIKKRII